MTTLKQDLIKALENECYRLPNGDVRWHDVALPMKFIYALNSLAAKYGYPYLVITKKQRETSSGTPGNIANSHLEWTIYVNWKGCTLPSVVFTGSWDQMGGASIRINGTPLLNAVESWTGYSLQGHDAGLDVLEKFICLQNLRFVITTVRWKNDPDEKEDYIIKLSREEEPEHIDEQIFYYCENVKEMFELTSKDNTGDFIILTWRPYEF